MTEGRVVPCCYNRSFVYGVVPDKSIHEIWFSKKATEFRERIIAKDLSHGCSDCAEQLTAKNFSGVHAKAFDHPVLDETNISDAESVVANQVYPDILEFELSNVCNFECVMCHGNYSSLIRKNREGKPPLRIPYGQEFVNQLREFVPHAKSARFLGGEPFLIGIYYEIWNLFAELNPTADIIITTNASVLNNRVRSVLKSTNCNIVISADSLNEKTYEAIRINANYKRYRKNIEFFQSYAEKNNKYLSFAVCAMKQNCFELPEIVRFCNERNINLYINTVWWPENSSMRFWPDAKIADAVDFLVEALKGLPKSGKKYRGIDIYKRSYDSIHGVLQQLRFWHQRDLNDLWSAFEKKRKNKTLIHRLSEALIPQQERQNSEVKEWLSYLYRSNLPRSGGNQPKPVSRYSLFLFGLTKIFEKEVDPHKSTMVFFEALRSFDGEGELQRKLQLISSLSLKLEAKSLERFMESFVETPFEVLKQYVLELTDSRIEKEIASYKDPN